MSVELVNKMEELRLWPRRVAAWTKRSLVKVYEFFKRLIPEKPKPCGCKEKLQELEEKLLALQAEIRRVSEEKVVPT